MPSPLTRSIFQRLILNKPIVHRGCLNRPLRVTVAGRVPVSIQYKQSRSLWLFNRKPPRQIKEMEMTPGQDILLRLGNTDSARIRSPSKQEIQAAMIQFVKSKHDKALQLVDHEAVAVHNAYRTLQKLSEEDEDFLPTETLAQILGISTETPTYPHFRLANLVFQDLYRRSQEQAALVDYDFWKPYVEILSKTGHTKEALQFLESAMQEDRSYTPTDEWLYLIKGFSEEARTSSIHEVFALQQGFTTKHPGDATLQSYLEQSRSLIIYYYAVIKEDLEQAKSLYEDAREKGAKVEQAHTRAVMMLAVNKNELTWAKKLIDEVISSNPDLRMWDVVFLWAAAVGKSVEEINRMMEVMQRHSPESETRLGKTRRPDTQTINVLVEWSNSKNNPYLGERFIQLGQKWNILPDAQTYLLQMKYRLSINDIDGARASYKALLGEEVVDDKDLPLLNQLIRAMIESKTYPIEQIMVYVQDLNDRQARFEPATVASLVRLHLTREELHDLIDLLHTHALQYSFTERNVVRDTLVDFFFEKNNDIGIMWDAYVVLVEVFTETPREILTRLMNEFFSQKRADMAWYVFCHMRDHRQPESQPSVETWIDLFAGIADTKDEEILETAHSQLKMDMNVEIDTRLRNALMMAYTACDKCRIALKFWTEISSSREGPTFNSIHLALRACEGAAWGDETAKAIWKRLRNMDLEITPALFASYVGALAGNGLFDEAQQLIQGCEKVFGFAPNAFILATYFNATQGVVKQEDTGKWIEVNYPDVWTELRQIEILVDPEDGKMRLDINRRISP